MIFILLKVMQISGNLQNSFKIAKVEHLISRIILQDNWNFLIIVLFRSRVDFTQFEIQFLDSLT